MYPELKYTHEQLSMIWSSKCPFWACSLLVSIVVLILGLPSNSWALKCADTLEKPEDREAIYSLKGLHNQSQEFNEFLESKKGQVLSQTDLQVWITKIGGAAENYLQQAGIAFIKVPVTVVEQDLNGVKLPTFSYDLLRLTESSGTSENARFINGILLQKKLKDVQVLFDPFLGMRTPGVAAQYEYKIGSISKRIFFTYDSLSYRYLGAGDNLRHELQHAFEHYKASAGEPTLANFALKNGKFEGPYSFYFALDEIESYLRDLRFLRRISPRLGARTTDSEGLKALQMFRTAQILHHTELINSMCKKAKEVLAELKTAIPIATVNQLGNVSLLYMDLVNLHYSQVSVQFVLHESESIEIALSKRIAWAESRITEVERELVRREK